MLFGVSAAFVTLPFLFVEFPPSTDLPQHVAHIRLVADALAGRTDAYTIAWWAPNNLVYLFLAVAALVFAPPLSGKVALMVLAWLWIAANFFLAWRLNRPVEHAVIASVLVFNAALYWGLLSFLVGWPAFALWLALSLAPPTRWTWLGLVGVSFLLYASHALWFAMGAAWLVVACLVARPVEWRAAVIRLSALIPAGTLAALWYPSLVASRASMGIGMKAHWFTAPHERLLPDYLGISVLKGIQGSGEPVFLVALLLWTAVAIATRWPDLRRAVDVRLLACAGIFAAVALVAPDQYVNTILFSVRWFPCLVVCFLLALPAPRLDRRALAAVAVVIVMVYSAVTARAWAVFERSEMTGLTTALEALPEDQRVLGLDFIKLSTVLRGRPFIQVFAYAQAAKGATLNFSFVEHASGLLRFKTVGRPPWSGNLEWFAERVNNSDLKWFDYLLVNAEPDRHAAIAVDPQLRAVTHSGRWRLYRIEGTRALSSTM